MASSGKILAEWVGPVGFVLNDGTFLGPGVVCEISEGEAHESDNWKPLTKKQADAVAKAGEFTDPMEGDE